MPRPHWQLSGCEAQYGMDHQETKTSANYLYKCVYEPEGSTRSFVRTPTLAPPCASAQLATEARQRGGCGDPQGEIQRPGWVSSSADFDSCPLITDGLTPWSGCISSSAVRACARLKRNAPGHDALNGVVVCRCPGCHSHARHVPLIAPSHPDCSARSVYSVHHHVYVRCTALPKPGEVRVADPGFALHKRTGKYLPRG